MTNLLCRIGIHHADWVPHFREGRAFTPKVRTCRRCGKPLPRPHR
jgi:hypothetical protein